MKVVAAGATGFIGRALVPELVRAGHEVVVLSRRPGASGVASSGAREVEWDGRTVAPHWANWIAAVFAACAGAVPEIVHPAELRATATRT